MYFFLMSAYEVYLKLFLKRWEEENFEWRTIERMKNERKHHRCSHLFPEMPIRKPPKGNEKSRLRVVKKILSVKKVHGGGGGGGGFEPTCSIVRVH